MLDEKIEKATAMLAEMNAVGDANAHVRAEAVRSAKEFLERHPLHLNRKYGGDLESAAESIVNEQLGRPREPRGARREGAKAKEEDVIDPTEKFEEGSMFNPSFGEEDIQEAGS